MMKLVLATLAMARSEEREKYLADTNVHRAGAEKYEPGDMCTVWRPPRSKELGGKLTWTNTGPYRVLDSQKQGREYRLQHLTTGDIQVHSVHHMHLYLKAQKFEELSEEQRAELRRTASINHSSTNIWIAKSPGHGRNTCECWSQRRMIPRREPECRHVSGKVTRA